MINLSQKIKQESKNDLFFSKFKYCLQFTLAELSVIRGRTHEQVEKLLETRKKARNINYGGTWRYLSHSRKITEEVRENCHDVCSYFKNLSIDHKLVISLDTGYFYVNDLQFVTNLLDYPGINFLALREAVNEIPTDSIIVKKSNFDFRSYFKSQHLSNVDQKNNLMNMLYNQKNIRLSPSFNEWFTRYTHSKYLADYYFIDYNDKSILTMINLVCPIKIKKTFNIIRDK